MKIFIGSSTEADQHLREVEAWVSEKGNEVIPWDQPGLFQPGESTFESLIRIANVVDAAIFLFSDDDKVWFRNAEVSQPRDNILLEFGLFVGLLGRRKSIVCKVGDTKTPSDLAGINFTDLTGKRKPRGRLELSIWCDRLQSSPVDPAVLASLARQRELEQKVLQLQEEVDFEKSKSSFLSKRLAISGQLDLRDLSQETQVPWKLLFDYGAFRHLRNALAQCFVGPKELKELLDSNNFTDISERIGWSIGSSDGIDNNPSRTNIVIGKLLRVFTFYSRPEDFYRFIGTIESTSQGSAVKEVISRFRHVAYPVSQQFPDNMTEGPK